MKKDMVNGEWAMGNGQWATGNAQSAIGNRQMAFDSYLEGKRQWAKGKGLIAIDKRLRLPVARCRLLIANCLLPVASCRLLVASCKFLIAFCILLIGMLSCNQKGKGDSHNSQTANDPALTNAAGAKKLASLLQPTNEFVLSSIPVTTIQKKEEQIEIEALGNIAYDTREAGSISSKVAGRIEKLYIHYRYQPVARGQHIMDIYSPEMMAAQQNLLFLLKNDAGNASLIQASKDKLLLLGMSPAQLQQVTRSGKAAFTIAVYSKYSGHIHESSRGGAMNTPTAAVMKDIALITEELALKEGMYVQKGQPVFEVNNPARAWAILNIYGDNQGLVKVGNKVRVVPETAPGKDFRAAINFIEPFYRKDSKTLTARVYFNNGALKIPIGSQVRATIFGNAKDAYWLPKEAVLSLGMDKVVFQKVDGGFKAHVVTTGILHNGLVQIMSGLSATDSVAANAQYLMDSESFIKIKN